MDLVWAGQAKEEEMASIFTQSGTGNPEADAAAKKDHDEHADGYSPETSAVIADESRDRCVVCGINFNMDFDNDDCQYKYYNCREIDLMNDAEIALNDSEEVFVTCWRGLGSPKDLTMDQVLHDALH
eukprot:CAMPEP_0198139006 /NCGR_PEP_ID=MMETSP1443-20131203/2345_1 /TAXON_ID=186043 /ORGANISM="Entomoneis sp., Strain CCMP2396" /LENGTH=126 /DNA_ID=CAMNT_0043800973 /DNA_START=180 /DNA_END=560 /DNA_ORIENTATION=-